MSERAGKRQRRTLRQNNVFLLPLMQLMHIEGPELERRPCCSPESCLPAAQRISHLFPILTTLFKTFLNLCSFFFFFFNFRI